MSTHYQRKNEPTTVRAAGFTLLEMLLVLAILVAITAVTIPVVERMYDAHRIRQAATEVRTALSAARLRAIDSGAAWACHFEPDGRHLVVLPSRDQGIRFGQVDQPALAARQPPADGIHLELPPPLYFWTADGTRRRLPAQALQQTGDRQNSFAGRPWSAPIVFAASGTSSDTTFEIRDRQGRAAQLDVRGLTGAASSVTRTR